MSEIQNLWRIRYDAEERYPNRDFGDGACTACGRALTAEAWDVNVSVYGEVIVPGTQYDPADSQGYWTVGPECIKKVTTAEQRRIIREHGFVASVLEEVTR